MMDKRRTAEEEGHRPIQGDFMAGMLKEMMRCCTEIMKPPKAIVCGAPELELGFAQGPGDPVDQTPAIDPSEPEPIPPYQMDRTGSW